MILGEPPELSLVAPPCSPDLSKCILFFDQPDFEHFTAGQRERVFGLLRELAEMHGFRVGVKLHPAQSMPGPGRLPWVTYYQRESIRDLLKVHGIGIGICSTVGIEVLSNGVPMIYLNENSVLDHYLQIRFLRPASPQTLPEAKELVLRLQEQGDYRAFFERQWDLLCAEYRVVAPVNPSKVLETF